MNVAILFCKKGVENLYLQQFIQMVWKYYQDRQELAVYWKLRHIFYDYPNWKTMPIESIIKRLTYVKKKYLT
jgi:hypothetical protein